MLLLISWFYIIFWFVINLSAVLGVEPSRPPHRRSDTRSVQARIFCPQDDHLLLPAYADQAARGTSAYEVCE